MPSNYVVEMWIEAIWDDRPWQRFGPREEYDSPYGSVIYIREVPEPFQAGFHGVRLPWDEHRGWPQACIIGDPHFNIERTNPEWR